MKQMEDNRIRASDSDRKHTGDHVMLENEIKGKLIPLYDPNPYIVTKQKGPMITARRGEKEVTRNTSRFKKVTFDIPEDMIDDDDNDEFKIDPHPRAPIITPQPEGTHKSESPSVNIRPR